MSRISEEASIGNTTEENHDNILNPMAEMANDGPSNSVSDDGNLEVAGAQAPYYEFGRLATPQDEETGAGTLDGPTQE